MSRNEHTLLQAALAAAERECGASFCGWCQAFLGLRPDLPVGQVSHGICPACAARVESEDDDMTWDADVFPGGDAPPATAPPASSAASLPVLFFPVGGEHWKTEVQL